MSNVKDDDKALVPVDKPLVSRDDKGRFVKGYSGNPAGKPKGVKHRSTLIKQTIDAAMADMLHDDFIEIMSVALRLAKQGDKSMIKLLLGDFLNEVRGATQEGAGNGSKRVEINITNLTTNSPNQEKTVYEHRSIEGEAGDSDE